VRVAAPQVKVNLAAPDMKQIARAVDTLASAHGQFMDLIGHLENEQHKIMREISNTISSQTEILRQLAAKSGDIKVAAPIVKMAPRPDSFYVELEKDRGETVGMRIRAESPN
jgi:nucleoside-triphosphatase THEP1